MTIKQIYFTSRKLAESLAGDPDMAIISITDPGSQDANLNPIFGHVLRLSFFDALPADDYLPAPMPGLFDRSTAILITEFVQKLHEAPYSLSVMVHCECGVSRSAGVALFIEALTSAPLEAREFTYEANPWVLQQFESLHPDLQIDRPRHDPHIERRTQLRA